MERPPPDTYSAHLKLPNLPFYPNTSIGNSQTKPPASDTSAMSPNVLSARDTNAQVKPVPSPEKAAEKKDIKSLEFHRQVLQSRMNDGEQ